MSADDERERHRAGHNPRHRSHQGPYRRDARALRRPTVEPLYTAGSLHEAQLLLDALHEAAVEALIVNEHLVGGFGQLPFGESLPRVAITNAAQRDEALEIVRAFEERMKDCDDAVVLCPSCREENPASFELCWSCRAEL